MRWRIWPIALALSLGLVGFVAGWAIVFHDPDGGQPVLRQRLPTVPAVLPTPPQPAEPADDPSGQVIIRDP